MKTRLTEIYRIAEGTLRPEQERLVQAAAHDLHDIFKKGLASAKSGAGGTWAKELQERLRQLLRDSEAAEGEDPREIEVGGPPTGAGGA